MNVLDLLDMFFRGIQFAFQSVFSAIPPSAQPFLISLCVYSIMAMLSFAFNKTERKQVWKCIMGVYIVCVALYTIWSFGLLNSIPDEYTVENIAQFISIMFYILLGIVLGVSFYKQNSWISKLVLVFIWVMFLLTTWIIAPLTAEMQLSENTLYQTLVISVLFVVPKSLNYKAKKEKVQGEK